MSKDYPNREEWLKVRKAQKSGMKVRVHVPDIDPKTKKYKPLTRLTPKVSGKVRKAAKKLKARTRRARGIHDDFELRAGILV